MTHRRPPEQRNPGKQADWICDVPRKYYPGIGADLKYGRSVSDKERNTWTAGVSGDAGAVDPGSYLQGSKGEEALAEVCADHRTTDRTD